MHTFKSSYLNHTMPYEKFKKIHHSLPAKKNLIFISVLIFNLLSIKISYAQYVVDYTKFIGLAPDPLLSGDDQSTKMAVDVIDKQENEEYIFVVGSSNSSTGTQATCDGKVWDLGHENGFVSKVDKCGNQLWFKYIGMDATGANDNCSRTRATCVAVDEVTHNVYVGGYFFGNGVNCTPKIPYNCVMGGCEPYDTFKETNEYGEYEGFIAIYDPNGNLITWTYFGGLGLEYINAIEVFEQKVYITGNTQSWPDSNWDVANTLQPHYDGTNAGSDDVMIAIFDQYLCDLLFFSYLGGPASDRGHDIKVFRGEDDFVYFYLAGTTDGALIADAQLNYHLQGSPQGESDAFISLWRENGNIFQPQWVRYVGGVKTDRGREIALIDLGNNVPNVVLTGWADTTVNPTDHLIAKTSWYISPSQSHQQIVKGPKDAFLAKFQYTGLPLWATYFGDAGDDLGQSCAVIPSHGTNKIVLCGLTDSEYLPITTSTIQGTYGGGQKDNFLAIFPEPTSTVSQIPEFVTYCGGTGKENKTPTLYDGPDVAIGGNREIYIYSHSNKDIPNFKRDGLNPTIMNVKTSTDYDAYLAKIFKETSSQYNCGLSDITWLPSQQKSELQYSSADFLRVFPLPFSSITNVNFSVEEDETALISIIDIFGEVRMSRTVSANAGQNFFEIDASSFPTGIYIIFVNTNGKLLRSKAIKL